MARGPSGGGRTYRAKRPSVFERLGRSVVHHPWRYIAFWLVILAISVPAVTGLSSVFTNSMGNTLPSSDTSVVAQNQLNAVFPNASGSGSSSLVLLTGTDITGPVGQNATWAVTRAIEADPQMKFLGGVQSLYTAYAGYLSLEAGVGLGALGAALASQPSLPTALNLTVQTLWGPLATYVVNWSQVAGGLANGTSPSAANWPAYVQSQAYYNSSPVAQQVLSTFYYGDNATDPGFNQTVTSACLTARNVSPCADAAARTTLPGVTPSLFPSASSQALALLALENLALQNRSDWPALQAVGATYVGEGAGLPSSWVLRLWDAFPNGTASSATIYSWCVGLTAELPVAEFPLPLSPELRSSFVSPHNSATLLIVTYTEPDNFTLGSETPIFQDVDRVHTDVSAALGASSAYQGIGYYQTGSAPIDQATSYLATNTLGLLLSLTIVLLIVIMMGYFRAPAAPLVTFTGIGVSVFVTLAGLFLIGKYVTTISSFLESVLLVFLMAIVTDYSIFMMARYREELVEGRPSQEAVISSVRWAGQSITTSGLTVFAVALAMVFSGIGFLYQLGIALAIAVVVAILMALTIIPAVLTLVGPRVFWPYTKQRFVRDALRRRERIRSGRTYFSRAGSVATRRPVLLILVILLISVPVVYVALNVPVSYDLTDIGLPSSNPAEQGLTVLEQQFGQSSLSSSYVLVTFQSAVLANGTIDPGEIADVASLTALMNATPGVALVSSLAGPDGSELPAWLNLSELPIGPRTVLLAGAAQYVGTDERTVQFEVVTSSSGYSASGSAAFESLEGKVRSFASSHPEVAAVYFGGAAPTTRDFQTLTNNALEGMLIGVSIGIFVILLVLLGAAFVPALALSAIGLSILWSWATIYAVVGLVEGISLTFLLPLILIILVLGLGMDYNALFLTRVKEERLKGEDSDQAIRRAVTHAGGVVTAAAVILGGPFLILGFTSSLGFIAAIGLGIGMATLLQAFVAQTYLTPSILSVGQDRIWWGPGSKRSAPEVPPDPPEP